MGLTILRLKGTCLWQQNCGISLFRSVTFHRFHETTVYNVDMELWPMLFCFWFFCDISFVCVCVCVWLPFWCHPVCGSLVKALHGHRGTAGSSGLPEVSNQMPPCRSRTPAPSTWSYLEMDGWGHTHMVHSWRHTREDETPPPASLTHIARLKQRRLEF